jgi:hypothetical protein
VAGGDARRALPEAPGESLGPSWGAGSTALPGPMPPIKAALPGTGPCGASPSVAAIGPQADIARRKAAHRIQAAEQKTKERNSKDVSSRVRRTRDRRSRRGTSTWWAKSGHLKLQLDANSASGKEAVENSADVLRMTWIRDYGQARGLIASADIERRVPTMAPLTRSYCITGVWSLRKRGEQVGHFGALVAAFEGVAACRTDLC